MSGNELTGTSAGLTLGDAEVLDALQDGLAPEEGHHLRQLMHQHHPDISAADQGGPTVSKPVF